LIYAQRVLGGANALNNESFNKMLSGPRVSLKFGARLAPRPLSVSSGLRPGRPPDPTVITQIEKHCAFARYGVLVSSSGFTHFSKAMLAKMCPQAGSMRMFEEQFFLKPER
jgi:hypothetical protein